MSYYPIRMNSVAEFVKTNVDVLVSRSAGAIRATKQATKTIPIVMVTAQDPVETGRVDSFARPGGTSQGSPGSVSR